MLSLNDSDYRSILDGIVIPSKPSILAVLIAEQESGQSSLKEIADLISSDIGLSSAVLRTINSAAYNLRSKVISIEKAVSLLGLKNITTLATALSLGHDVFGRNMEFYWMHSVKIALITSLLAKNLKCADKNEAHMFGLFHDCGQPLLSMRFSDYWVTVGGVEQQMEIIEIENQHFQTNHALLGAEIAKQWNLPSKLCDAILLHHRMDIFNLQVVSDEVLKLVAVFQLADFIVNDEEHQIINGHVKSHVALILEYLKLSANDFKGLALEARNLLIKSQEAEFITPL